MVSKIVATAILHSNTKIISVWNDRNHEYYNVRNIHWCAETYRCQMDACGRCPVGHPLCASLATYKHSMVFLAHARFIWGNVTSLKLSACFFKYIHINIWRCSRIKGDEPPVSCHWCHGSDRLLFQRHGERGIKGCQRVQKVQPPCLIGNCHACSVAHKEYLVLEVG